MCLQVLFMVRQKEGLKGVLCEDNKDGNCRFCFLASKEYIFSNYGHNLTVK